MYNNLTIQVLNGSAITLLKGYTNGRIYFEARFTSVDDYIIYVTTFVKIPENAFSSDEIPVIIEPASVKPITITLITPPISSLNSNVTFIEAITGIVNSTQMREIMNNSQLVVYLGNSNYIKVLPTSYTGNLIYYSYYANKSGSFSVAVTSMINGQEETALTSFYIQSPISQGMNIRFPSTTYEIEANTTNSFVIYYTYTNGTLMNQTNTIYSIDNTEVELFLNGNYYKLVGRPTYISPGEGVVKVNITILSNQFSIKAYTGPMVFYNNPNATGFTSAQITTVNYNPSQNPADQTITAHITDAIIAFWDKFWQIIVVIGTALTIIVPSYQIITTDRRRVRTVYRQYQVNQALRKLDTVLTEEQKARIMEQPYRKQLKYLRKMGILPKKKYEKLEYLAVQNDKTHKLELKL